MGGSAPLAAAQSRATSWLVCAAMTGAMFPNHTQMSIGSKADFGPISTRMRYSRPKYKPPKELDVAEAGSYLPLYQLRAMGVRTPSPEAPEPFTARDAAVPALPNIGGTGGGGSRRTGPLTHPRGNTKKKSTTGRSNGPTGAIRTGGLNWEPTPPPESRVLRHGRADGLKGKSGTKRAKPLRVEPMGVEDQEHSFKPFSAADTLRVAMAVVRAGEHNPDIWSKVASEVGGGRVPEECRQCWIRIVRARCSVELREAVRTKDLPGLRKALGRAAALQYESPEVRKAELKQAELEALVRDYDDGIEGGIDHVLSWVVQQLVSTLRTALYKTATGQNIIHMLRRWDHDGSGEITYEEFVVALRDEVKLPTSSLRDEDIRLLFEHVDADGSGTVEPQELVDFLHKGSGQRLRGASKLPDEEKDKHERVMKQAHEAGQLEAMMFQRDQKGGPARLKKAEKIEKKKQSERPLKELLDALFEEHDSNRYNILLQTNGFEQVSDVKLASSAYFEALGMPAEVVEKLLGEANKVEEEVEEVANPKLVAEVKALCAEWFSVMDDDGSGAITMYEATDLLNSLGPREGSRLSWGELLAEMDTNRDGQITVDEVEGVFLREAPTDDDEFEKMVLTPLRDLQKMGWEVVDVRKKKAQASNPRWQDESNNEGGVTDLRRIREDPGEDNHNKTMKLILSGLESAALVEQEHKKKKGQKKISDRLAKPSGRFKLFGQVRFYAHFRSFVPSFCIVLPCFWADLGFDLILQIDEDEEIEEEEEEQRWLVARDRKKEQGIDEAEEDDAIVEARRALVAAGVKQIDVRPIRRGWIGYEAETPRRFIILDRWREHAIWEKKCRGIVLRMNIMRQYIQLATMFSYWQQVIEVTKRQRDEAEAIKKVGLMGKLKRGIGKDSATPAEEVKVDLSDNQRKYRNEAHKAAQLKATESGMQRAIERSESTVKAARNPMLHARDVHPVPPPGSRRASATSAGSRRTSAASAASAASRQPGKKLGAEIPEDDYIYGEEYKEPAAPASKKGAIKGDDY